MRGRRKNLLYGILFLSTLSLAGNQSSVLRRERVSFAPDQSSSEYDVKAAFLLNFGKFIAWPKSALAASDSFNICIVGKDPFGDKLERTVHAQTIGGKQPRVRRIPENAPMGECQIAFIDASDPATVAAAIKKAKGTPTLTVGETPGFAEAGGMIQFKIEDQRIRFMVNLKEAKAAGLEISSKLLDVAEVIQ